VVVVAQDCGDIVVPILFLLCAFGDRQYSRSAEAVAYSAGRWTQRIRSYHLALTYSTDSCSQVLLVNSSTNQLVVSQLADSKFLQIAELLLYTTNIHHVCTPILTLILTLTLSNIDSVKIM